MKRFWIALSVLLGLGLGACSKKNEKPMVAPPVKVTVITVGESSMGGGREYSGTVSAENSTVVSFSVAGTVTQLYAKEGDKVSAGQILGKLKSGDYENAYNIAQAQLAEAQDGYDRLKKLHDANALPEVKWVDIQQKLKEAQNMAEIAARTLQNASLHSPVNGTITRKFADEGQNIVPAQPIYEITSLGSLSLDIPVSETEIAGFQKGQKARVSFASDDLQPVEGVVSQKAIVADPLSRSYTVKVSLPNLGTKVLPGMIGTAVFQTPDTVSEVSKVITLPSGSVMLNEDNRWFVWVVEDSVAQRRFVTADALVENGIAVQSGLQSGDMVIVEGIQKVGTGTRVVPLSK